MYLLPAIDILGGKAVRLAKGDYDRVTVVNTGTTDIVISANPMLAISKMCG